MPGFLADVCVEAEARVQAAARLVSVDALRARNVAARPSFADALSRPGVALIAEVKRASPSRGDLAAINDAGALARQYAAGGAAAVSVLTEPRHFKGGLDDLETVARTVDLPVLRKDFLVDPYQVWEARAHGASAVLLIVAALTDDQLTAMLMTTVEAGVGALVEVHSVDEVDRMLNAHATADAGELIVGVNARNLGTLDVDLATFERVHGAVPDSALLVAESGVSGPADVRRLADAGADAVLVGEHLVTAPVPAEAVRALVEASLLTP